jgi:hypothetical protein
MVYLGSISECIRVACTCTPFLPIQKQKEVQEWNISKKQCKKLSHPGDTHRHSSYYPPFILSGRPYGLD